MEHGINKCRVCEHYLGLTQGCTKCSFEWAKEYPPTDDKGFDILNLDDDLEWSHFQILDRLHFKGIECLFADIWNDNNIALLFACKADKDRVASALGVDSDCIYDDFEHGLMIINLFQEKYIRGLIR